jgi:uncharacterized protein YehS (DUF1456 family)
MLDVSDARMAELGSQTGYRMTRDDMIAWLKTEEEPGYRLCSEEALAHVLDGLILARRGQDPARPLPPVSLPLYNNLILKKLRVAFELREDDLLAIMAAVGHPVSRPTLSALFRNPDHPNYRRCGDQFLRQFLKGLTRRLRG